MKEVTFVTGNARKAEYMQRLLGFPIRHHAADVHEIQSLDQREIIEHKAREAYQLLQTPVLVEDVSLEFTALGKLPGTFIRWFLQEMSEEAICRLLDASGDRRATARCTMAYFDGETLTVFEKTLEGTVPEHPRGEREFGWDKIFIPKGYQQTRAELNNADDAAVYLQIKPIAEMAEFLKS